MSGTKPTVLVTGGAGYIGSHAALALRQRGYSPIVLDNLSKGHRVVVERDLGLPLIVGDAADRGLLGEIFEEHDVVAIMHFAAWIEVGESVTDPGRYYRNNVCSTLSLLEAARSAGVVAFVFSSSAAVYGDPGTARIVEDSPVEPVNPYGRSKAMVEQILEDFERAHGLRSVRFRYFNAAGADPEGRIGEWHDPESHLIPRILAAALEPESDLAVFGADYPTPDGTCVRDYVHVADLAEAHVLGLDYLLSGGSSITLNLGNGEGFSVREVLETARAVTQREIPVRDAPRREGDPPRLVADASRARDLLGWQPAHPGLREILEHAWAWESAGKPSLIARSR